LQFIGEHYSARGRDQVIYFKTDDMWPTKGWKAAPSALDQNQPTVTFSTGNTTHGVNPLVDRSLSRSRPDARHRTLI
jgi:hypothetical protein